MKALKVLLPFVVLGFGFLGFSLLQQLKSEPEQRETVIHLPLVETISVHAQSHRIDIHSQGTVQPQTVAQLTPLVGGPVTFIADNFKEGGFIEKDQVLLKIQTFDYEQALTTARANLAQAKLQLQREKAEAVLARQELNALAEGTTDPLALREYQVAQAESALAAAQAEVDLAERNLARCIIRAPFQGRVTQKAVDLGQFVSIGQPFGTVYALEAVEVRLPITTRDSAWLDLPLGQSFEGKTRALLEAQVGETRHRWEGQIVRTDGMIDPKTRMIQAVASVKHPFGKKEWPAAFPLTPGLFVQATIEGKVQEGCFQIPRDALWEGDRVLCLQDDNRLFFREVNIIHHTRDHVLINKGLEDGTQIVTTRLEAVVEGMKVRRNEQPQGQE